MGGGGNDRQCQMFILFRFEVNKLSIAEMRDQAEVGAQSNAALVSMSLDNLGKGGGVKVYARTHS